MRIAHSRTSLRFTITLLFATTLGGSAASAQVIGRMTGGPPQPSKQVGSAEATYDEARNEISVQSDLLQIISDGSEELTLTAYFSVFGRKVKAPTGIEFSLVTSSLKRQNSADRILVIKADQKLLFSRPSTVLASKSYEGVFREVLKVRLTLAEFDKLVSGQEVAGRLGKKEFMLTAAHLAALRDLKRCIDEGVEF